MSIYIEYLLIENVIINFIILYVVARITRTKINKLRLFVSAIIGSIYTIIVFYPSMEFMGKFLIKVSISILMVILAYNPETLQQFIKQISAFYLVSFAFAGAIIGIFYIVNNNSYSLRFSFKNSRELSRYLTVGIIVATILLSTNILLFTKIVFNL